MAKIREIKARQILDSRGNPTVEADVVLADGSLGRASVPSGASTGLYEAIELRDGDPKKFNRKSVYKAVSHINEEIAQILVGQDAVNQRKIDQLMIRLDGTPNKGRLGANATLAVSLAVAAAEAKSEGLELFQYLSRFSPYDGEDYLMPFPMLNVINGGKHAIQSADFQEYMIVPRQESSFADRIQCGAEVFYALKRNLEENGFQTIVGDEGGFAPGLKTNASPMDYMLMSIEDAGYKAGADVFIAIDPAASELYENGEYNLKCEHKFLHRDEMIEYYGQLVERYPILSLEDPLDQNDFEGWALLTERLGQTVQIVGDDLFATNLRRMQHGIKMNSANSILVKPNQIGTLTETMDAITMAHANNMTAIISHRSGETEDTFIADLSVAMRTGQIKTGSLSRSERLAKYNRLLRIEEILRQTECKIVY